MLLRFGDCELDMRLFALRRGGQEQAVEPLVFNLLAYLARHRDRVVGRDELLDALWAGKVVSASTLNSCIKAARRAVGDDGQAQRCIATIARRGYRFVAPVAEPALAPAVPAAVTRTSTEQFRADGIDPGRRARIAVMPFTSLSAAGGARGGMADALAHDVITGLARLRSLFVIAQGSVFALHERGTAPHEAAQLLKVDYFASGSVQRFDDRLVVTVELVHTQDMRIVWTEAFEQPCGLALQVRDLIASRIVACVAAEVELAERHRALLKPPDSLDAWEAYHRGLWHMYLFNRNDNELARRFFDRAVRLDPGFAPAYAGLSFTHFQNAFQGWAPRGPETDQALERAGQSLIADERNPIAHWALGRALWLRGQQTQSVHALQQAIALSPSFALGHYTLAFVNAQAGDPQAAISSSDQARRLSPFDPLLFGMLGARALALVRRGHFDEAAACAVEAASQPNAHQHILGLAACSLALANSLEAARAQAAVLRLRNPRYGLTDFLAAFRLDADGTKLFSEGARRVGLG